MHIVHRYRLLPRVNQHRALERILESQRQLYNAALEERIDAYRKAGLTLRYFDQSRGLSEWRASDEEAREVPVTLQRATLKRVQHAYDDFFRRVRRGLKPGFPRFRGKGRFNTFGFNEFRGIQLHGRRLHFKGMPGGIRIHLHRELPLEARVKMCTLTRGPKGWHVSFVLEIKAPAQRAEGRCVGVDLGITTFAALSDGGFIPSLRAARRGERRLRLAHRALSRKRTGSSGWRKARTELVRQYAATRRLRREHVHQASARLVRDYDVIAIEDLRISPLARSCLAKDVRDAGWAIFISLLRYKAECAGVRLIEVPSEHTSQECSNCGVKVPKPLRERRHDCPHCGLSVDRDLNAARNILKRAGVGACLRNVAEVGMRAGGNLDSAEPASQ